MQLVTNKKLEAFNVVMAKGKGGEGMLLSPYIADIIVCRVCTSIAKVQEPHLSVS